MVFKKALQMIDFEKMSSALVAIIETENSEYRVKFSVETASFELSGGHLIGIVRSKYPPEIDGIGTPMHFMGHTQYVVTSPVKSITIKLDDDDLPYPIFARLNGGGPKGGAPLEAYAVPEVA